jgi:hypothetical protein
MCIADKLTGGPCGQNAAGTTSTAYMAPASEFATFPAFQTNTAPGDGKSVLLTGNFDFAGAGSGKGYFREIGLVLEKNGVQRKAVGGRGSRSIEETLTFYVAGADQKQLEWFRNQLNIPGVWLIKDKNGVTHCLGTKEDPAFMEEADMNTGQAATDERGTLYVVRAITATPKIYTGLINLTPIT